ncbi:MAG TPA: FtsQ-type POTRA domain-containing protein [Terriglobia bacterium]|nr:FtsQ-type POTRA domain-containing protein [Terriglobia bacterium]
MDSDTIPAEDLELEEVTPYRRRAKAGPLRRTRISVLGRMLRWTALCVIVLPGLSYSGYRLGTFALSSGGLRLESADDVAVTGNHVVSREEILNALGLPAVGPPRLPVNLFQMSLDDKRRSVEAISWVRSAVLSRSCPRRLEVKITERTPVAFVDVDARLKLVDGDGVLLEKPEKGGFDFPVLSGVGADVSEADRRQRLVIYGEFMRQLANLATHPGWSVSEVDLSDPDDLKALLVENQETVRAHFGDSNFGDRFQSFLELLPEVRKTNTRIESVDLRYRNQIVVNPQPVTGNKE